MKKMQSLVLIALTCLVFSCDNKKDGGTAGGGSKSNWTETERNQFVTTCTNSAAALGDKAKPYCECSLEKLEKKYPNSADVSKLTNSDTEEIAKDCLR